MSSFKYQRLERRSAMVVFIDHQTGLISLVQDFSPREFKNNVMALAAVARFFQLPTVFSTVFEEGPNGPLVPELGALFPEAPFIPRPGQLNAWDNPDFVETVKHCGRRQLIIAGVPTDGSVCYCALSALEAGYQVFVVTDASGALNEAVRHAAWLRMANAGAQLVSWLSVAGELQRDWHHDVEGLGYLLAGYIPAYAQLIAAFQNRG